MSKHQYGEIEGNKKIFDAIKSISGNFGSSLTQSGKRHTGFVSAINANGTIDVTEYSNDIVHPGVLLSAIQNNQSGMVIIPSMYSEVVIATDTSLACEFVVLYSHADTVRIQSHGSVKIGAVETREYSDADDTDMDDLEETGNKAVSEYDSQNPVARTIVTDDADHQAFVEVQPEMATVQVGSETSVAVEDGKVVLNSATTMIGGDNAQHPAVLGDELCDILSKLLEMLGSVMTATSIGPQPFINMADFMALKVKIDGYKASVSGFLSPDIKLKS